MAPTTLFERMAASARAASEPLAYPLGWPFGTLKPQSYGVIYADPAWRFTNFSKKGEAKNPLAHYDCMSTDDMLRLPVRQLAAPNCALVMWATAPMLPDALRLMTGWGFTFKSAGAWAKQSSTGRRWAFGTGYCFRSAAEFFLLGTIGKPKSQSNSIRNLIVAPTREHSRKPDEMHANLETMFPDVPRCELFARTQRPGWDAWGNETTKFDAAT
jgi:N6-adenosine-specific RNA methylase IME4